MLIEDFDPATADERTLHGWHDVAAAVDVEVRPDLPPDPLVFRLALARHRPAWHPARWWLAWDETDRRVLGSVVVEWYETPDNRHRAEVSVLVHPAARRQGAGRRLLQQAATHAESIKRPVLGGWSGVGTDGDRVAQRLGFRLCQLEERSVLKLADLDQDLLHAWVDRAAERARDYRLVAWNGACPDELVDSYAAVAGAMNTAPRGETTMEDIVFSPERLQSVAAVIGARGHELRTVAAQQVSTGRLAGFTETVAAPERPWLAEQEDTGVLPEHRNLGLGRWLKAAMALQLVHERPEVERLETWNASENAAMLGINRTMGFRLAGVYSSWEIDLRSPGGAAAAGRAASPWPP